MYFRQVIDRTDRGLAYVLADLESSESLAIDPAPRTHPLLRALLAERGLALRWLLRTHTHRDNAAAYAQLCAETGATLVDGDSWPNGSFHRAGDDDIIAIGNELVRVLPTPGQTPESLSFQWRDRLFCGDVLDCGGGRSACSSVANPGQLYDSVTQRIFTLPGETLIFPNHDSRGRTVSTVAEERACNPFFAGKSRDEFVAALSRRSQRRTQAAIDAPHRRSGRDGGRPTRSGA
jgi:glyoxylase-like metal-dependent hydrolase (beta-lactamase superfamily II)